MDDFLVPCHELPKSPNVHNDTPFDAFQLDKSGSPSYCHVVDINGKPALRSESGTVVY